MIGSESESERDREGLKLNCLVPTDNEESEGEKMMVQTTGK